MQRSTRSVPVAKAGTFLSAILLLCAAHSAVAQNTPLISGGVGFTHSTRAGATTYTPIIEPNVAWPLGDRFLVESRGYLLENYTSRPKGGFSQDHIAGFTYLQGDLIVSPNVTIVGGSYQLPFNTYNERLEQFWIGNFQDGPLILNLAPGLGVGGQLRGSAVSRRAYLMDYTSWFSARSGYAQFNSERSSGGRLSLQLPPSGLEVGSSYTRLLQGKHENLYGAHLWWEPEGTAFRLRSEFGRGQHAEGYWIEADYRAKAFGGLDSWVGRFEPLFRMQQTFRLDNLASDGLPPVNTQRADFGLDYNLPHNTRILTSYSRQFSSSGNANIWETAIVYRILFPAWKGKL